MSIYVTRIFGARSRIASLAALSQYDIVFLVVSNFQPAFASQLREVARLWADVCDQYLRIVFNVDRVLRCYFPDSVPFLTLMNDRHIMIAGSVALDLFRPVSSPLCRLDSGLDIFVEAPMGHDVCAFVEQHGYRRVADNWHDDSWVTSLTRFSRPSDYRYTQRIMHYTGASADLAIYFTRSCPLLTIMSSPLTSDFHFFTATTAFSLFPRATLLELRSLVLYGAEDDFASRELRLQSAGFQVQRTIEHDTGDVTGSVASGCRWLGDSLCWTVPLCATTAFQDPGPYSWRANGFSISYRLHQAGEEPRREWAADLRFERLDHRSLFGWTYVVPPGFSHCFDLAVSETHSGHGMWWRYERFGRTAISLLPAIIARFCTEENDLPPLIPG